MTTYNTNNDIRIQFIWFENIIIFKFEFIPIWINTTTATATQQQYQTNSLLSSGELQCGSICI